MSQIDLGSQMSLQSLPNDSTQDFSSEGPQEDIELNNSSPPTKGWINQHFTLAVIDGKNMRVCTAVGCDKQYAAGISTKTYKNHWKLDHSMRTELKKTRYLFHNELHINRIIKAVINLHWDFTTVDDASFRAMLNAYNANKGWLSRKTLANIIKDNKQLLAMKVASKLAEAESVALTFDIWSARKGSRGFGCITAHYINSDGQLINFVLNFERMKFPHNAPAICKFIARTINQHKLNGRIVSITTDNASNNIAAIDQLRELVSLSSLVSLECVHYRCLAHVIDLGIKEAMKDLNKAVVPVRDAVLAIRSSSKRRERFAKHQEALVRAGKQEKVMELTTDVVTRWNSALIVLERAARLRDAIDFMMNSTEGMKSLEPIDWPKIEVIIHFLRIFFDATNSLCSASEPTISIVSLIIPKLINHCALFESHQIEMISNAALALREKLSDYECELYNPVVNIAQTLDPRFKMKHHSDEVAKIVRCQLSELLQETPEPLRDSMMSATNSLLCDQSEDDEPIDELETYLTCRRVRSKVNVIEWWRNHADQYPKLAIIARKILPIQATSVASERLFSEAGDVDTKSRNRLSDESVEAIVLFKSWMKYLNIE